MTTNQRWETAEDRCGRNIRILRDKAGISQGELARRMEDYGVSLHQSAIAKIELRDVAGARSIRVNEADAAARALGVTLADLNTGPQFEFQETVELLDKALAERERVEALIEHARDRVNSLHAAMWQGVQGGISAEEAQQVYASQRRIAEQMADLGDAPQPSLLSRAAS